MRALVIDRIHPAGVELLQNHLEVTHLPDPPTAVELGEIIGEYDALMMRVTPRIDSLTLFRPGSLKVIGVAAVGIDHIDLTAATDAGIQVVNLPGINRDSVAEFTFGLLINLARSIPQAAADVRRGVWNRNGYQGGLELRGRTMGVIGFGHSGSRVAELAVAFGMRSLVYSPYTPDRRAEQLGVTLVSLEELLAESDFVSVHCSLNPQTRNLISARQLALMRPGSYLLNLARGGIVDERALFDALCSGHLAGAAADVFEVEPPGMSPLLDLPNFIGTPHVAGPTRDSLWRAAVRCSELILQYLGIQASGQDTMAAAGRMWANLMQADLTGSQVGFGAPASGRGPACSR